MLEARRSQVLLAVVAMITEAMAAMAAIVPTLTLVRTVMLARRIIMLRTGSDDDVEDDGAADFDTDDRAEGDIDAYYCFRRSLLIDTGTNSSNYISQYLFDRWKDARHLPQQVHVTVRGGLSNKLVHILCHFPFYNKVSEIKNNFNY